MPSITPWRDRFFSLFGLMKGHESSFPVDIHPEIVYRALLDREIKRSARSGQLCRILLIYHTNAQGRVVPFGSTLADNAISVLSSSCRDTDYIGWYQQGRVVGILLTAQRPDFPREGYDNLKTRVVDRLRGVVTSTDDHSLQIRVLEENELTTFNAVDHPVPSSGSKN